MVNMLGFFEKGELTYLVNDKLDNNTNLDLSLFQNAQIYFQQFL